jgi:hypothetical protein
MGNLFHQDVGDELSKAEWNATAGETGQHLFGPTVAVGDIPYAASSATTGVALSSLLIGPTGAILTVSAGVPSWNTTLNGTYTINGGVNVTGNITGAAVSGTTSLFSPSATFGTVNATGAATATGLTVNGTCNITGAATATGVLTAGGGIVLSDGKNIQLFPVTTNGAYSGITVNAIAIVAVTAGQICFMNASGHFTTGCATAIAKMPVTHMAMANIAASSAGVFLSYGYYANSGFTLLTAGAPFYAATGVGVSAVSSSACAATGIGCVQVLGRALSATSIFFNPDMTVLELV